MILRRVTLENFRNIEYQQIEFTDGINILVGKNAQGKTNILEAINFCSYLKSFRGSKEEQLIRFGADKAYIKIEYETDQGLENIEVTIFKDRPKELKRNGMTVQKNRELIGSFLSTVFTPDYLNLIKEGPNKRRSFLDMLICALDIKYTDSLLRYQKVLSQRNALLKKADGRRESFEPLLEVYDEKLAEEGAYIALARAKYIGKLDFYAKEIFEDISKSDKKIKILYINQFAKDITDFETVKKQILDRLYRSRNADFSLEMTTCGIQKDDMLILQGGKSLKFFGSQGQVRSAVLSLILAEGKIINEKYGVYPVIILDDILSELDRSRQKYIFCGEGVKQCLLSTCETMKARGKGNILKVREGRIV
ncbi:MAG: DNA replication/repair protein RecF [Clostridia bacterium]|nr:DNA replication/repair protein RecF [Clostridia bacterium]